MNKDTTKPTPNVPFENRYYLVVLSRQGTNVETTVCCRHQQKRIVETELLNLHDVGWQDFGILATASGKQPIVFDFERR